MNRTLTFNPGLVSRGLGSIDHRVTVRIDTPRYAAASDFVFCLVLFFFVFDSLFLFYEQKTKNTTKRETKKEYSHLAIRIFSNFDLKLLKCRNAKLPRGWSIMDVMYWANVEDGSSSAIDCKSLAKEFKVELESKYRNVLLWPK